MEENKMKKETALETKFVGKKGWLIFWLIFFFPIAIYYFIVNRKTVRVTVEQDK